MGQPIGPGRARRLAQATAVDTRPLRHSRDFRLLWAGQLVSLLGRQITTVAIPFQVYSLTGSALALGALGAVQVVPLVLFGFTAGALADRVDRRRVLLATNLLLATCSALLALGALTGSPQVWTVFALAGLIAALGAVDQPARSATVPNLVPRSMLPAAVALMFGIFQITLVAGPALGGLIIGHAGLSVAYICDVVSFSAAIASVALIAPQPPTARGDRREGPLRSIRTGFSHLRHQRAVVAGFAIDLDAMIFGMPRALFPVLAARTFGVGPGGLGLLYAAPGVGALLAVLTAGWLSHTRRLGRVIVIAVIVWGAAITLFGLVGALWLALMLLAIAGAADSVSAISRSTMLQITTPDSLRGRVSATYATVVVGGPYIGDAEAGAVAFAFSPPVSVVSGGLACLVGAAAVSLAFPELWDFDSDMAPEVTESRRAVVT
ncbi:MAG: MFS transporter [Candidatus Dormibacteria bacterium]